MLECVVNEHVLDLLGKLFFRGCLLPCATFLFCAVIYISVSLVIHIYIKCEMLVHSSKESH